MKRYAMRDTPEMVAERIAYRNAVDQATAETFAKYPEITADNFADAVRFKDARIEALIKSE